MIMSPFVIFLANKPDLSNPNSQAQACLKSTVSISNAATVLEENKNNKKKKHMHTSFVCSLYVEHYISVRRIVYVPRPMQ